MKVADLNDICTLYPVRISIRPDISEKTVKH
jgi:hypothetical protein